MTIRIYEHNASAWDEYVAGGNRWTRPVDPDRIAAARRGDWKILLTPTKPVPGPWFPPLHDAEVLCLASGGGQQGPILAAAGARVTVFDASARQLEQDRGVAQREGLPIETVQGDMADLKVFADGSFDLIVHPVSNCFVPDVRPVWREAYRVLKPGGALLAGFSSGLVYLFDEEEMLRGELQVRHSLPYSDLDALPEAELRRRIADRLPLEFGHTLEDQIGGQLEAGFVLLGLYEDRDSGETLARHAPMYVATRARRPAN